jgi:hypothetical protein
MGGAEVLAEVLASAASMRWMKASSSERSPEAAVNSASVPE